MWAKKASCHPLLLDAVAPALRWFLAVQPHRFSIQVRVFVLDCASMNAGREGKTDTAPGVSLNPGSWFTELCECHAEVTLKWPQTPLLLPLVVFNVK